jgi:predicted component of type VI protein secretion system
VIVLRLFKASDPFQELEARELVWGEFTIGRHQEADWGLRDTRGDLSRKHCIVTVDGDDVHLEDTSTNGVFLGSEKRPAPRGEACQLKVGDAFYLGEFMILVDSASPAAAPPASAPLSTSPEPAARTPGPAVEPSAKVTDAALLEAFCGGARLEASSFVGEDPLEVMNRLGVVYRQVVDDLCALMRDRAMLKDQYQMERTTISARDNNPLKWAPPERIAVELLQEGEGGFLKGAAAFKASFADLRRHGGGLMAGSRAAVRHVLEEIDPARLETDTKRQPLHFLSKFEAAWKHFRERHADLAGDAGAGEIERAFRRGYEEHLRSLDTEDQAA